MSWYNVKMYKGHKYHYIRDDCRLFCSKKKIIFYPRDILLPYFINDIADIISSYTNLAEYNWNIRTFQKIPPNTCKKCDKKARKESYFPFTVAVCKMSEAKQYDTTHIWSFNGYYFINEHGCTCICSGCSDFENLSDIPSLTIKKAIKNGHCVYCECYDCVCELRKESELFEKEPLTQYWDNPCMGSCGSCSLR